MIKIMVVDDEYASRSKLAFILKKYGLVNEFDNGSDALIAFEKALLENKPFSLVTMDISMPQLGGLKVLNKMRALESDFVLAEDNNAKIIMVTSNDDIDSVKFAVSQKCNAYIVKPFEPKDLTAKLETLGII